jgi:hypothetical protein
MKSCYVCHLSSLSATEESFTVVFQMLLCVEYYENVYTYRRKSYPSFNILKDVWSVGLYVFFIYNFSQQSEFTFYKLLL